MPRNRVWAAWVFGPAVLLAGFASRAAESSCPVAAPAHVDLPATRAALSRHQPITIVALGSSSTLGVGATAPDRTYPARLTSVLSAAWPDVPVTVLNEGVGGQTVDEVMPRLETDVLATRPTLVIWQTGANEMLRGIDPARFAAQLDEGVRRILDSGADVVLMDNQVAPRLLEDQQAIYDGVTAKEAQDRHVSLFSRTRLMREWRAVEPASDDMIGPDGLHHTDRGYGCLAAALGQAMIDATARSIPVASVKKK